MGTQVNVSLNWLQRRKLTKHPYVITGDVKAEITGDLNAWKWRRNVYLHGDEVDINVVLIYVGHSEVNYNLLRPRTKSMALPIATVLITLSGGAASAGNYGENAGGGFGNRGGLSATTPRDSFMSNICCGKVPNVTGSPTSGGGWLARGLARLGSAIFSSAPTTYNGLDPSWHGVNSAPSNGFSQGRMETESRGSGVSASSFW